jgi:hypothetical protein
MQKSPGGSRRWPSAAPGPRSASLGALRSRPSDPRTALLERLRRGAYRTPRRTSSLGRSHARTGDSASERLPIPDWSGRPGKAPLAPSLSSSGVPASSGGHRRPDPIKRPPGAPDGFPGRLKSSRGAGEGPSTVSSRAARWRQRLRRVVVGAILTGPFARLVRRRDGDSGPGLCRRVEIHGALQDGARGRPLLIRKPAQLGPTRLRRRDLVGQLDRLAASPSPGRRAISRRACGAPAWVSRVPGGPGPGSPGRGRPTRRSRRAPVHHRRRGGSERRG